MQKCLRFIATRAHMENTQVTNSDLQDLLLENSYDFQGIQIILDGLDEVDGNSLENQKPLTELPLLSRRIQMLVITGAMLDFRRPSVIDECFANGV